MVESRRNCESNDEKIITLIVESKFIETWRGLGYTKLQLIYWRLNGIHMWALLILNWKFTKIFWFQSLFKWCSTDYQKHWFECCYQINFWRFQRKYNLV